MQQELINRIIDGAQEYMRQHELTQAELCQQADIPPAYLSNMLNGRTTIGNTAIHEQYWIKLSNSVGVTISDDTAEWKLVMTPQFKRIIATLETSRTRQTAKVIIGDPGTGKTLTIEKYRAANPKYTYVLTMHDLISVVDIINMLIDKTGCPATGSKAMRLANLIIKFRELHLKGYQPMIIIDEAENLKPHTMKLLKGLFDGINKYCSIVLVGTNQLITKMTAAKKKDKDAAPQFYRRFMPGAVTLPEPKHGLQRFMQEIYITDTGLQKLLLELCENYGELNAWLEPVIVEAAAKGVKVDEEFFRTYHNLPVANRRRA